MPALVSALKAAGPMPLDDPLRLSPIVDVVRQAAAGGKIQSFSWTQPGG
jgi:hypothetical protein